MSRSIMNLGIVEKAYHETWRLTLILGGALMLFGGLLAYVLPTFRSELAGIWRQIEFVQNLIRALVGSDLGDVLGPHVFQALPWVHPVILALIWAQQLTVCSRMPAGEIEHGTIDVLFGLPVSRWEVYISETIAFFIGGVVLFVFGVAGNYIGHSLVETGGDFPALRRLIPMLANGYCLYAAVGGICYFITSLCDRRGRAVGTGFAVVLVSFMLTFIAQFWEPAKSIVWLSLMNYYRPMFILQAGMWPLGDMAILAGIAGVTWIAGGIILNRRDVCTV